VLTLALRGPSFPMEEARPVRAQQRHAGAVQAHRLPARDSGADDRLSSGLAKVGIDFCSKNNPRPTRGFSFEHLSTCRLTNSSVGLERVERVFRACAPREPGLRRIGDSLPRTEGW